MTILADRLPLVTTSEITAASDVLSEFIVQAVTQTAENIGFRDILVPVAPSTFATLGEAYQCSRTTGGPLPASSENSDDVIHKPACVNGALRFWHDVNHVRRQLDFGLVDEPALSQWHLGELQKAGHPSGSLVWRLHADLTGQAYGQAFAQRFPFDQRRFVTGCFTDEFDHGLLTELRQGGPA